MNHGAIRGSRLVSLTACLVLLAVASSAEAYRVRLAWRPVVGAIGYKLYAQQNGFPTATSIDLGLPAAGSDGIIRYEHSGPLVESTNAFALTTYDATRTESPHSNEIVITYAVAAAIVDTDADGMTDAREDVNLNLTRDSGETDRQRADTDGDGFSDGAEVTAGSDPLSAASRPGVPTATRTATPVRTATATPPRTMTPTPVRTLTATPVRTVTATPVPTITATPIRTVTATPARTATATTTGTATPVLTTSPTRTIAPTQTVGSTHTPQPTRTPKPSPTPPSAATPTRSATPSVTATPLARPSAPPPLPATTPLDTGTIAAPLMLGVERVD